MATIADPLIADRDEECQKALLVISRGTAILLFGVYIAYLIFQLKTHASLFASKPNSRGGHVDAHSDEFFQEVEEDAPNMSVVAASSRCVHALDPGFFFVQEFFSLLFVTIIISFLADYREYQ